MNNVIKKKYLLIFIITILIVISFIVIKFEKGNSNNEVSNSVVKVGVYDYKPCYSIKDNNISGYYYDVLKTIDKYDNFKYEYYIYSFDEVMNKVESGELDLVIGVNKTDTRLDKFIFSHDSIGMEKYGLFCNSDNIEFADFNAMENYKLGIIKSGFNGEIIKKIFKNKNIDINIVEYEKQSDLIQDFRDGKLNLSIQPINESYNYGKVVYEFCGGPVYIAVNKNKGYIVNNINKVISENSEKIEKSFRKYYKEYFDYKEPEDNKYYKYYYMINTIVILITVVLIYSRERIKLLYIQLKIRSRIYRGKYIIYYQPIYELKNEEIVGFEALIRQKSRSGKIIGPYKFIQEIEDNSMMSEIALMMLKKITVDYKKLYKKYNLTSTKYISINVSADEISNENFVNKCCDIIKYHNLSEMKICLEIIERFKSDNIKEVNKSIEKLKEAGFLIAIDDFGMEYSNLDLLNKIDFDIIKLDRYFTYSISKDYVKEEILKFLSSISKRSNTKLVIEGVETKEQVNLIKDIDNANIYVQGYYYSKPVSI